MTRNDLYAVCALALGLAGPASAQSMPMEPTALPAGSEQGIDMLYVDPAISSVEGRVVLKGDAAFSRAGTDPKDPRRPSGRHAKFMEIQRGLGDYRAEWGTLPQVAIPPGPTLRQGQSGERVALLRKRLGLLPSDRFDASLTKRVIAYERVHGLATDGIVGGDDIYSLNLGASHYERVLEINLERALRLPAPTDLRRHIVVDAGSAKVFMYQNGVLVDSMLAVVGAKETQTPMMAALIRYAVVNPYWNVPPDLVKKSIAPRVLEHGLSYLTERRYEVFANWTENAKRLDPSSVDWQAVVDGWALPRLRRGPGPGNSMGDIKFMMPNTLGIYLHDTHDRAVFAKQERWLSNGCVRVEDAKRLAVWLFGSMPSGDLPNVEKRVDVSEPVAVFLTYLTVEVTPSGLVFRTDRYGRDAAVLERAARKGAGMAMTRSSTTR